MANASMAMAVDCASAQASSPLDDLSLFADKKFVVLGGYGAQSGQQQWRSMWDAWKQYGDGLDPPKEEIERSRGCNYYCGDCHALSFTDTDSSTEVAEEPEWSRLDFGREASALLQRTGHTLTSLQAGGRLLFFGGRNLQRSGDGAGASAAADLGTGASALVASCSSSGGVSCCNDAWLLEVPTDTRDRRRSRSWLPRGSRRVLARITLRPCSVKRSTSSVARVSRSAAARCHCATCTPSTCPRAAGSSRSCSVHHRQS